MSTNVSKGTKRNLAKGTFISAEILESDAYLSLRGIAPQVLTLFLLKRYIVKHKSKNGKEKRVTINKKKISFTYIEAEKKYGISQPRFTRAIDELLAKGFITIEHNGGTYKQDKSVYGLSDKYLLWKPDTIFEERKKDLVQRGFRKPKKQK